MVGLARGPGSRKLRGTVPRLANTTAESAGSLPRDSEEARALLQSRLALFGKLGAVLSAGFLLVVLAFALTFPLPGIEYAGTAQGLCFALTIAISRLRRVRKLPGRWLVGIDYAFTWTLCSVFVAFGFGLPTYARPELVQLLCVVDILAARAFLIPSTTRRTALVGAVPMLAVVISTYLFYRDGMPWPGMPPPASYVALAFSLTLGPLAITSLTSRTIYGLRMRAREAMQLGQYTLLEKIGAGGMGVVYKARHATLRRPTAIKLLPPALAGENNLQRFEREVQLTCQLTHPNTIAIYDYGRSAEGVLYYAMEYLDGLDLESILSLSGPLPEARVVRILAQVGAALAEAHDFGLIHRDIKPQNVLLCRRGGSADVVKVVDFGLVKELDRKTDVSLSTAGSIVGTPLYMSPEAIVRPEQVDARSDLYAMGALGYFLLTGTPPFRGGSVVEICGAHLHAPPDPPSQRLGRPIFPELEALILRCLEKKPENRPESAFSVTQALGQLAITPWTRADAKDWWSQNAEAIDVLRQRRGEEEGSVSAATVAVDLRERSPHVEPWQSVPGHAPQ